MRKRTIITCLIVLIGSSVCAGISGDSTVKRIRICELYQYSGFSMGPNPVWTVSDFRALAPNSALLRRDFNGYSSDDDFRRSSSWTPVSIVLGLKFYDKKNSRYRRNLVLRAGISYFTGIVMAGELFRSENKPYDTIIGKSGLEYRYVVRNTECQFVYKCNQLRLDGSLLFRIIPENRWSLYAGVGLTIGASFNAHTTISSKQEDHLETYNRNGDFLDSKSSDYLIQNGFTGIVSETREERYSNKTNFPFSLYLPIGFDVRLGNKNFWQRLHLYFDLRVRAGGLDLIYVPELYLIKNSSTQVGMGFRYIFN